MEKQQKRLRRTPLRCWRARLAFSARSAQRCSSVLPSSSLRRARDSATLLLSTCGLLALPCRHNTSLQGWTALALSYA